MSWWPPSAGPGAGSPFRGLWRARHTPAVLAVVLGLAALLEYAAQTTADAGPNPSGDLGNDRVFGLLLALSATLPTALARASPAVATVMVTVSNTLSFAPYHGPTTAGAAAQLLVLYEAGRHGPRALTLIPVPIYVGYAVATTADGAVDERIRAVLLASGVCLVVGAGTTRRARDEAKQYSAAAQAVADSLHEHAARGERARIARELHDVVAHHISMIAVQAETARLTTPGLPPDGAKRFLAVGDTARSALTEMRRLLGVLREDAGDSGGRRPQPALDQLIELVDDVRDASGAATRLIVRGHVISLDHGIELTAYRIVQEALTNARRHAPGAAVDVELSYHDHELRLRIRDNGPGPTPGPTGHGLLGMHERATMVGGNLHTTPAPNGGFLIEVTLPLPAPATPTASPNASTSN